MAGNDDIVILVVNDVEEIRDGLESLLAADGYRVQTARSGEHAIECALRQSPQLILMNLAGSVEDVIASARGIMRKARLQSGVPVILFCVEGMEGREIDLGGNLYSTRPDNFNDLRSFLRRVIASRSAHPAL